MPEKISHYTPFRSSAFAFVQVKRGGDEATLSGLELFIDFEGNAYKTTLRSPDANGMRRYVFNLSDMAANDKAPKYASVAPIFLERGRSFVGDITSNALIPYAKIVLNITELVLELDGDDDNFVIVLDNDVTELDYNVCNPSSPVEDPWGGCAVYSGDIFSVMINSGQTSFDFDGNPVTRHVNPWARAYFCAKLYRAALTVPTNQLKNSFLKGTIKSYMKRSRGRSRRIEYKYPTGRSEAELCFDPS